MTEELLESIERDHRAMERMASAFEVIADNSTTMVKLLAQWYDKLYPPKQDARDVTLTSVPSTVDELKASQGATEETTEEWLTEIGPREREFIERSKTPEASRESRLEKKPGRARSVKG